MVVRLLSLFLLATLLSSCASVQQQDAPIATSAPMVNELFTMTPPERKVPIAVYKFNNVTGQRKIYSTRRGRQARAGGIRRGASDGQER